MDSRVTVGGFELDQQRDTGRALADKQHDEVIGLLRGHGERIARLEGRDEALATG